jgi:toxin FitB
MIILDTNIISEIMKFKPHQNVESWLNAHPRGDLFLNSIILSELYAGAFRLPEAQRRVALIGMIADMEDSAFEGRILPFDARCARDFGLVTAARERAGLPIGFADAAIAATALTYRMRLATRNTGDFDGLGLELINPFEA